MPVGARQRLIRRVLCVRGEMTFRVEVDPRFDYGREAHETVIQEHGVALPRPLADTGSLLGGRSSRPDETGVLGEFALVPGESESFVLETVADGDVPDACHPGRDTAGVRGHRRVLAPLARPVALSRALAGDGAPLRARPQAPHLPAVRSDGRSADHEPAGADRRRPQLGLPLHVDPGHRLLPLRAAPARLHGRGGGLHGLADRPLARARRSRVGTAPDHVRGRRQLRAPGRGARRTSRATGARRPCGSGTAPPTSSSSTSTAS